MDNMQELKDFFIGIIKFRKSIAKTFVCREPHILYIICPITQENIIIEYFV